MKTTSGLDINKKKKETNKNKIIEKVNSHGTKCSSEIQYLNTDLLYFILKF